MKECERCGKDFTPSRSSQVYCNSRCKNAAGVTRWRQGLKVRAVAYKGGKCERCGYDRCVAALEFHHPGEKDFGLSAHGHTRAWGSVKAELDRCELVCTNCHREEHDE